MGASSGSGGAVAAEGVEQGGLLELPLPKLHIVGTGLNDRIPRHRRVVARKCRVCGVEADLATMFFRPPFHSAPDVRAGTYVPRARVPFASVDEQLFVAVDRRRVRHAHHYGRGPK